MLPRLVVTKAVRKKKKGSQESQDGHISILLKHPGSVQVLRYTQGRDPMGGSHLMPGTERTLPSGGSGEGSHTGSQLALRGYTLFNMPVKRGGSFRSPQTTGFFHPFIPHMSMTSLLWSRLWVRH